MSEKIIDRIKKLFALANNNANQHERQVALEHAGRLMDEYNIEQHHLQEKSPEPVNQATSLPDLKFVGILIMGVAKLNHCWPYVRRNAFGENEIFLVGTPENISVTLSTMEWLISTIRREADSRSWSCSRERAAFMFGMAAELQLRCKDMMQAEKHKPTTGTELVVIRNKLETQNQKLCKEIGLRMREGKARGTTYTGAYNQGKVTGRGVNLGKQITDKTKRITQNK